MLSVVLMRDFSLRGFSSRLQVAVVLPFLQFPLAVVLRLSAVGSAEVYQYW